jgi:8-oxo-dGTP pyrophosphatase MutT (NUDIX family)
MINKIKTMEISAGLVIIQDNKILLEHPTGSKWLGTYSIPKGQVEEGENHLEAAIRETQEELGIKFDSDDFETEADGYINYTDEKGHIDKRVYYFVVEPDKYLEIDKTKLEKDEIDWAGFLTKEEAEKRIYWRFKSLLKYLE